MRAGAEPPRPAAGVRIRELGLADHAAVAALWDATEDMRAPGREEFERLLERNPGLVLGAEAGGELVAAVVGVDDGRRGWIWRLAVIPSQRRRGIAVALVRELERRFCARGVTQIRFLLLAENATGRAFWEELGYELFDGVALGLRDLAAAEPEGQEADPC